MKVNDTHCFALIGHTGDGKTSLGEAILHRAGATTSLGIVTEGTSHLSTLPEEKERQSTLTSSTFGFEWSGKHLTLVDTPGDSNFQADGRIALCALDGAILLVSAASGPKVGTQRMWQFCQSQEIPLLAFVNAMDKERSDFPAMIDALKQMGANPVAVSLPIGHGDDFKGAIDLLKMNATTSAGESEIPSEFAEAAADARAQLVEAVAECDDSLLEKYLEEGELTDGEVAQGLVIATRARQVTPVFCGAAISEHGVETIMQGVIQLLPSAADREPWKDANDEPIAADPDAPFAGVVFKTVIDRYAGALSVFRVVSGTAHSDSNVLNPTRDQRERFGKLQLLRGAEHVEVDSAGPGDIVAVAKLKDTHTGDVLGAEKNAPALRGIPIPQGVISYAL
ncbi:MAG: GTP-binding protein, partial [Myxococcota bacterium]